MSKFILSALMTFSFFSSHLFAQTIENQVESLRLNFLNPEISVLNKILAADLVYGHSNAKNEDKASLIDNLTNGNYVFTEISVKDQSIKLNKNMAIVRHTLDAKTKDKGIPSEIHLKVILVWKKEGKIWQLWERQAVKYLP